MKKRILSLLLCCIMLLGLMPTAAFAAGSAAHADITGEGTAENPYLIYTAAGLKAFRDRVNGQNGLMKQPGAHAKLMNDIVLNDGTFDKDGNWSESGTPVPWEPIGYFKNNSDKSRYAGTFDGGGHTIKGLYVTGERQYAGLFGITTGATIKNVTVDGYVSASGNDDSRFPCTGGIVGGANNTRIENCTNLSTVKSDFTKDSGSNYVGGIAGNLNNGTISNCRNSGKVILELYNGGDFGAGGIVGSLVGQVSSCYNTGAVTANSTNSAQVVHLSVGGVVGKNGSGGLVDSCYNTGAVTVTGDVSGTSDVGFGGVVGINVQTVSNCYFMTGTATNGVGKNVDRGTTEKVDGKTKAEFANGTVLGLLKQSDTNSAWDVCGYVEAAGMTLPLLEWQTRNARTYDIYILGKQITSLNQKDVLGDGTVSFVYDEVNGKGILTLDGFRPDSNISPGEPIGAGMENLEIVLKGENKIETTDSYCIAANNLTFSGNGSIELSTDGEMMEDCVHCSKTFTVDGGNIKIRGVKKALYLRGALTVNGGTLELISTRYSALDVDRYNLQVILGDDRIMITGTNPDGSGAQVTDASDTRTVDWVNYIKIFNKYIPIVYDPGQYGTGDAVTENKTYGENFGLADALFTRTGYRQTAWTTAENGGDILRLGSAYSGNESLTLYPVWEMEQYGITYDLGGGTVAGNPDSYTVESESFTLKNPAKDGGYEFAGWSGTGLTGTDNKTVTVTKGSTGDREYTAHWRDIQAPTVGGLENGKTYCSAVEFTAADNDGIDSVTVNAVPLQAENGKYTLTPAQGKQTVVVTDKEGNKTTVVVTVNDGHSGGKATCTDKAVCEVCGESYGQPDAKNHGALKHFDAKAATETAEGSIEYWFCPDCGKYFADKDGAKEITKADTVTVKLPPTPKQPETPKTGDEGSPVLWMTLPVISGGAAILCRRRRGAK